MPDRPALGVADRKQHPAAEAVVEAAAAGGPGQNADRLQHLACRLGLPPACLRIQSRSSGEKPRWNCSMLSAVMPRSCEVPPGRLGLGRFEQALVILPLGPGHRLVERPLVRARRSAGSTAGDARPLGLLQRDAGPIGQHGQGLAELDAFHLHHEAEDVAADVADPALERLPLGIDLQAGPRVVVPGAQGHVAAALAAKLHVAAHQIDDVDRLPDLFLGVRATSRRTPSTPVWRAGRIPFRLREGAPVTEEHRSANPFAVAVVAESSTAVMIIARTAKRVNLTEKENDQ